MKTYRRHNCAARHGTANKFMRCAIPRAAWVHGEGEYASIAWCDEPTVLLFATLAEAEQARAWIDQYACGSRCVHRHDVVRVEVPS